MATENYTIGKGELWFAPFTDIALNHGGFRHLGNCPDFRLNVQTEDLDHFSSRRGIREKDATAVLSRQVNGNVVCDDLQFENLALFFMGSASTLTQASAAGLTQTFAAVKKGYQYQIGETLANPMGVRGVTTVVVKDDQGAPVTFVLNTDYTLDTVRGTITVLDAGSITNGTNLVVTYAVQAATRQVVVSGESQIEGALKFVSYNSVGEQIDYLLPRVKLRADGDFGVITEEWQQMSFALEGLKKGNLALLYANNQPVIS